MKQLFKLSDILILFSATLSLLISINYWFTGFQQEGMYIGLWVPSILGFGIYTKLLTNQNKK